MPRLTAAATIVPDHSCPAGLTTATPAGSEGEHDGKSDTAFSGGRA